MSTVKKIQKEITDIYVLIKSLLDNLPSYVKTSGIVLFLLIFGLGSKLIALHGITNWDEGWFVNVCQNMINNSKDGLHYFFLPLYGDDISNTYKLFDKPLLTFWFGVLSMFVFGFTDLGAKFPMAASSGLMAIWVFLIFDHRHTKETKFRIIGIVGGVFVSLSGFLNNYGRTAYIDPIITSLGLLACMLAVRAIDYSFWNDKKRTWLYLGGTGIVTTMLIFAKAWQGLIFGPAVALYLLARVIIQYCDLSPLLPKLKAIFQEKHIFSTSRMSLGIALITSSITFIIFQVMNNNGLKIPLSSISPIQLNLNLCGVFLAIISFFLCNALISELQSTNNDQINYLFRGISTVITSLVSTTAASIIYDVFYELFETPMDQIVQKYLMQAKVMFDEFGMNFSENLSILTSFIVAVIVFSLLFLLLEFFSIAILNIKDTTYKKITYQLLPPLIPLIILGGWLGFWGYFILLKGYIFGHEIFVLDIFGTQIPVFGFRLTTFGILIAILLGQFTLYITKKMGNFLQSKENELIKPVINLYQSSHYAHYIKFTTGAVVIAILSFLPFLLWLGWIDTQLAELPYIIRVPGELVGRLPEEFDGKIPSYTWLFFEYYIGWRYENPTHYNLYDSLNAFDDAFLGACLPLAITGLIGFILDEEYDYLALFTAYFATVLVVFFPAAFQLNYYYLPAMMPIFVLAAKGAVFIFRTKSLILNDNIDKFLLSIPFLLMNASLFIFPIFGISSINVMIGYIALFIISTLVFTAINYWICNNIIDVFSLTGFMYFFNKYVLFDKLRYQSWTLIIVLMLALLFLLIYSVYYIHNSISFRIGKTVRPMFAFIIIIFLLGLGGTIALSNRAYWNCRSNPDFQRIGKYIINHGGDYDNSTYIFPESGANFALSYYMNYDTIKFYGGKDTEGYTLPGYFASNSTSRMNGSYYSLLRTHPYIQFFVILQDEYYVNRNIRPEAHFSESYQWLKDNYRDVTTEIGSLPHYIQVFGNSTLISTTT